MLKKMRDQLCLAIACWISLWSTAHASTTLKSAAPEDIDSLSYSPPRERPNSISVEIGGRAGSYSVNYDRALEDNVSIGVGLSTFSVSTSSNGNNGNTQQFVAPIYANFYNGWSQHRGYLTIGTDISNTTLRPTGYGFTQNGRTGAYAIAGVGYEYRGRKAMLFRAAAYSVTDHFSLWMGGSLGYSF